MAAHLVTMTQDTFAQMKFSRMILKSDQTRLCLLFRIDILKLDGFWDIESDFYSEVRRDGLGLGR